MKVTICEDAVIGENDINTPMDDVAITDEAAEAIRLGFNPSTLPSVRRLKMLAAAFISAANEVAKDNPEAGRVLAVAKTNMQTASMWAVLGATKGL